MIQFNVQDLTSTGKLLPVQFNWTARRQPSASSLRGAIRLQRNSRSEAGYTGHHCDGRSLRNGVAAGRPLLFYFLEKRVRVAGSL